MLLLLMQHNNLTPLLPADQASNEAQNVFAELLDSLIVDVAAEAHRAARLGFDYRLDNEEEEEAQMSAHARATVGDVDIGGGSETGGKYTFDVFGLSHPTIAQDMFDCMNCGRPIVAGRFAPHLEKCMGKGRKARLKANHTINSAHHRRGRTAPMSSIANSTTAYGNRTSRPAHSYTPTPEDSQHSLMEFNAAAPKDSPEDDKDLAPELQHPGKTRSKKNSTTTRATTYWEG
ncbi:unnamed protein product [Sphagnum balticum]